MSTARNNNNIKIIEYGNCRIVLSSKKEKKMDKEIYYLGLNFIINFFSIRVAV